MLEKTQEKKGAGVHLDIVLLSLLNMGSGVVGGPWVCAATVSNVCLSMRSARCRLPAVPAPGEGGVPRLCSHRHVHRQRAGGGSPVN